MDYSVYSIKTTKRNAEALDVMESMALVVLALTEHRLYAAWARGWFTGPHVGVWLGSRLRHVSGEDDWPVSDVPAAFTPPFVGIKSTTESTL